MSLYFCVFAGVRFSVFVCSVFARAFLCLSLCGHVSLCVRRFICVSHCVPVSLRLCVSLVSLCVPASLRVCLCYTVCLFLFLSVCVLMFLYVPKKLQRGCQHKDV